MFHILTINKKYKIIFIEVVDKLLGADAVTAVKLAVDGAEIEAVVFNKLFS